MIHFKFKHSQYPIKIWVFFECTQPELIPYLNNNRKYKIALEDIVDDPKLHLTEEGKHSMFKPGNFLIWSKLAPTNAKSIGTLAHEIFHAVAAIRDFIGAPNLTDDTEEDWAYMTSWLTENIYLKYEIHSKGNKGNRGRRRSGVIPDTSSKREEEVEETKQIEQA
jgi:hypothetical protein